MLGAQPHLLQQLHYPCVAGCLIKGAQVTQGLGDTSADAALRVECARRVLEHQLHGTLEGPCLFAAQLIDGLSGEGHQPLARGFQPEQLQSAVNETLEFSRAFSGGKTRYVVIAGTLPKNKAPLTALERYKGTVSQIQIVDFTALLEGLRRLTSKTGQPA